MATSKSALSEAEGHSLGMDSSKKSEAVAQGDIDICIVLELGEEGASVISEENVRAGLKG